MKSAVPLFLVRCFGGMLMLAVIDAHADVNYWTRTNSGNWDEPTNWSLGVLPNSSQSIVITNSGWKAVAINPSTPVNYPTSMNIDSLTIQGAWDTENTLLLNYAGTEVPLTVSNGLTLRDGAQIVDFRSGLIVQSSTIVITNSQIIQDGGFIRTTNAPMYLQNSLYQMTNGVFDGGSVSIGYPVSARFNQYGGSVIITNLDFTSYTAGTNENGYSLYGGTLDLPGGMYVFGGPGGASYFQTGGTNRTSTIEIARDYGGTDPKFTLNGGLLADGNMSIIGGYIMSVSQNGGTHIVTNSLYLGGESNPTDPHIIYPATYFLNGGTLSAATIEVYANLGDAIFSQSNGTVSAQTVFVHGQGYYAIHNTSVTLAGGTLSCSNYTTDDGGAQLDQSGGALIVSNLLNFGGSRQPGGTLYPPIYATYTFTGGTLTASNINISGIWIIGDSFTSRITNAGTFSLSHLLQINNAVEQLGRFILATNAIIDLAGEASKLSFADSSAELWNPAAKLIVTNWNALTSGNYAGDELKFGTSQSGLTAAQLQQIHFINPAGLSPGDYAAHISGDGTIYPAGPASGDSTNDWTGPDGFWHDLTWSLGVRPDSSQSVRIIGGNRTVTVNATTAASYPESLTVHDLIVSGYVGTPSLVLSNAGTVTPLRVLNGLSVKDGAKLVNLNSGLIVDGTLFDATNSQIIQDGGYVRTTNVTMRLLNATYHMTNGVFEGGTVWAGTPFPAIPGQFNQYGGTVKIMNLGLYYNYSLYGGTLDLPGGMNLIGQQGGTSYFQAGGTNRTPHVLMEDDYSGSGPHLTLNGGLLAAGDVDVRSGWFGITTFEQNGGTHIVTNALNVVGGATTGATVRPATYYLNGGILSVGVMDLNGNGGDAVFVQTNGTVHAETIFAHSVGWFGSFVVNVTQGGGSLSCSNLTLDDGRGSFTQSGGALIVSNLLTITGYRDLNIRYYGRYVFTGGTVMASNINIVADWVIGDGTSNRISNPGFFSLSHTLSINNAVEQLGRFILATNATIDLTGDASKLSFANSSSETWPSGATLTVNNWNGNLEGGGAEQLRFGTDQSGLTSGQLNQIKFFVGTNFYSAKILSTGEVVPNQMAGATLTSSRQGNNLILNWPTGWTLQTATNILGPYVDLTTATSPFTNDMSTNQQGFFRLKLSGN